MVFKKRYGNRYSRKSKRTRRGMSRSGVRTKSRYTLTNIVDQVVRRTAELKYYTNTASHIYTSSGGSVTELFQPAQGMTDHTRIGDRVKTVSWEMRYEVANFNTSITAANIDALRVIVFAWKPNNGASPPLLNELLLTSAILSPYNHDRRQMFRVLYDRTHTICPTTTKTIQYFRAYGRISKELQNVQFSSATTEGTSKLYVWTLSASPGAASALNFYMYSNVKYYDS